MNTFSKFLVAGAATLVIVACGAEENTEQNNKPMQEQVVDSRIEALTAAVNNPARPEQDVLQDANRHPVETLAFFEIDAGETVVDAGAGGGYFTEILSAAVGPEGSVYMHNSPLNVFFANDAIVARNVERLTNVVPMVTGWEAMNLGDGSVDTLLAVRGLHDAYYNPDFDIPDWNGIDLDVFMADAYRMLKPGGVLGVIDHRAPDGAEPIATTNGLHRIDPNLIINAARGAGFVLEAESDLLANPGDDLSQAVFSPDVRGKTDQFVLRFRKPKAQY